MFHVKLLALDALYVLSGDTLVSPLLDEWVRKKKKELHIAEAKKNGAQWLMVVWEIHTVGYRYIPIYDQEEHDVWMHRIEHTAKIKKYWSIVEITDLSKK